MAGAWKEAESGVSLGSARHSEQRLAGTHVGIAGIVIVVGGALGTQIPMLSFVALFLAAACIAEGAVVLKLFPQSHPLATNAVVVTTGALILIVLSLAAGEDRALPIAASTWASFVYLIVVGTVVLFYLVLYVLARWTASATAYAFLLFPVATVPIAALLGGESITTFFVLGGALGLLGVWFGAISGSRYAATSSSSLTPE